MRKRNNYNNIITNSLEDFVQKLSKPRSVWVMVPAGNITEKIVQGLAGLLEPGDVIIDGGNSKYKDDVRRSKELLKKKILYVDAGTSGGVWGAVRGYCLMYGGEKEIVDRLEPIFKTLAPGRGTIERTPGREKAESTAEEGYLLCGPVGSGHYSGEGRWIIQAALERSVPVEVLSAALYTRFRSRRDHTFAEKILSAMRMKFGGHVESVTNSKNS